MFKRSRFAVVTLLIGNNVGISHAHNDSINECLLKRLQSAGNDVTVGELNRMCKEELELASQKPSELRAQAPSDDRNSVVEIRREADLTIRESNFVISTYKPNYLIVSYDSSPNNASFNAPEGTFDEEEIKFQVSFQIPIATELFDGDTDLMFAYTSTAWWQLFNEDIDNPFRETNYEPEIFFNHIANADVFGLKLTDWSFGINHQSNGQSGELSRGWDRLVGTVAFEITDDFVIGLKAWHILRTQDRNTDIERYMGYGEIGLGWAPNRNTFTALYRPATEGHATQLTWSYPVSEYLRVYAQYWNGYGESLLNQRVRTERIGLGIALNDVLER
ncbi:phospholipase A [Photobacterium rosenbergii]|uniref:Phospholipase A1 n=1 Tax=Photobacterium rosenbergii TaxID=294936 RepID=A0ABU3ZHM6_9GAMM|nr:phospholipase A [Photobacterium rosenbergii]MDV5169606.1 phospholipase A [Photobacterium rosenbergii]